MSVNFVPTSPVVEWYRPDRKRRIVTIFAVGIAMLLAGMLLVASSLFGIPFKAPWVTGILGVLGALATVGSPVFVTLNMYRLLRDESYLALCLDGVLFNHVQEPYFVWWEELKEAQTTENALCLFLERAEPLVITERFSNIDSERLAQRINHLRTKILLGLHPSRRQHHPRIPN